MSAVSIYDLLSILPSGKYGAPLSDDELSRYLQTYYNTESEKDRNRRHTLRDELYRDGGTQFMCSIIDRVFKDPDVRERRKVWVPHARFQNALKRVVNEMATTHSEPAKRFINDGQETYDRVLELVRMDEQMLQISRMLNLHRALLVGFRTRQKPDGTREPTLDIATPANVRAVLHPNDSSVVVAWMIRCEYRTARSLVDRPAWTLWTARESMQLRDDLSVIGDSYQEHSFGVIPWVPITLGPPCSGFWPGCEGEDLVAAHVAIWFEHVLLLKESKSATKLNTVTGDGSNTARSQQLDTEGAVELAEGQTATTQDMSMDLSMFRDTSDHALQKVALNYNISPSLVSGHSVDSAEARRLMRMPLQEIRKQQQIPLRRFEHQLAIVMALVLAIDLPELAFNPEGWRIEFGEAETPLSPLDEMTLFERRRAAGLDNPVAMLQRLFPGLPADKALQAIAENYLILEETARMARPVQALDGSLGGRAAEADAQLATAQDSTAPIPIAKKKIDYRQLAREVLRAA